MSSISSNSSVRAKARAAAVSWHIPFERPAPERGEPSSGTPVLMAARARAEALMAPAPPLPPGLIVAPPSRGVHAELWQGHGNWTQPTLARRLAHGDLDLQRARRFLPDARLGDDDPVWAPGVSHGLAIASGAEARAVLGRYLGAEFVPSAGHRGGLSAVEPRHLDAIWQQDGQHAVFADFVAALDGAAAVPVAWRDAQGCLRTRAQQLQRVVPGRVANLDANSDVIEVESSWRSRLARGHFARLRPATALALVCVRRGDRRNFARIVASSPQQVAKSLCDRRVIATGPLFTDAVIWEVMACAVPRLDMQRAQGRLDGPEGMGAALDNYLRFEPPVLGTSPQLRYALAFEPPKFLASLERIWAQLAPKNLSWVGILAASLADMQDDAAVVAAIINIMQAGVMRHLTHAAAAAARMAQPTFQSPAATLDSPAVPAHSVQADLPTLALLARACGVSWSEFGDDPYYAVPNLRDRMWALHTHLPRLAAVGILVAGQPAIASDDLQAQQRQASVRRPPEVPVPSDRGAESSAMGAAAHGLRALHAEAEPRASGETWYSARRLYGGLLARELTLLAATGAHRADV